MLIYVSNLHFSDSVGASNVIFFLNEQFPNRFQSIFIVLLNAAASLDITKMHYMKFVGHSFFHDRRKPFESP